MNLKNKTSKDFEIDQQKVTLYNGPFEVNKTYKIVEDLGFVGFKGDMNLDFEVNIFQNGINLRHQIIKD